MAGVYASRLPFRIKETESSSITLSLNDYNGSINSNQNKGLVFFKHPRFPYLINLGKNMTKGVSYELKHDLNKTEDSNVYLDTCTLHYMTSC